MIRLGGLVSQKAFGKFEMGKVISNPFANAFIKEGEGEDHEVSMANNSIDIIIKMATELKAKMGEDEKQIPAWIQDHIAKAENLISQASGNYHEYDDTKEEVKESMISEEFSTWEMSFDNMNLGGVQLNRKNKYKVKARNTVEAIKKAAKMAGVKDGQWMATKTYSLNKL